MKRLHLHCAVILFSGLATASAQDTFSIVAVDTVTGEVGSAGASCVPFDVAIISQLHPGVGAINTQAHYFAANQMYAGQLMAEGKTPSEIIALLQEHDIHDSPALRQYGIASLNDSAAAFTGEDTDDWKGHRTGRLYAVQGNILLGPEIVDSIVSRFERASGSLADRLMHAVLGARVAGADTRCMQYGTSSLGAFIRVARPGDQADSPMLDLRASIPSGAVEPLDSLERLFIAWKVSSVGDHDAAASVTAETTRAGEPVLLRIELARRAEVHAELYDALGRRVGARAVEALDAGAHTIALDVDTTPGTYFARVSIGGATTTCRIIVIG